jgi:L-fuculose-phosphate aldolase
MANQHDPVPEIAMRQRVIDTCLEMNARGLNQGTSGNVSVRFGDGLLITPSGRPYESLVVDDIVRMDLKGGYWGALLPSSEWRMHSDIYRAKPAAKAVVHVHSTYATAFSCLNRDVPAFHYMIAAAGGDSLRCADYATFGTQALSDAMLRSLRGRQACLLGNHGQIAYGPSLEKALWLAGEVELLCQQYCVALSLGQPSILNGAQMEDVLDRFARYGKQLDELDAPPEGMPVRRDPAE